MDTEKFYKSPEMKVIRLDKDTDVIRTSLTDEDHDVWEEDFFD